MDDKDIDSLFKQHPETEHAFAVGNYNRISHTLGGSKDLRQISHAWLNGSEGTRKALENGKDLSKHPYVKKVMDSYLKN